MVQLTSCRASAAMIAASGRCSGQERDTLPPDVPGPPSPHMPCKRPYTLLTESWANVPLIHWPHLYEHSTAT